MRLAVLGQAALPLAHDAGAEDARQLGLVLDGAVRVQVLQIRHTSVTLPAFTFDCAELLDAV